MIRVDQGVPIPKMRRRGKPPPFKYPWSEMKPGDSFLMPYDGRAPGKAASSLTGLAHQFNRNNGKEWTWTTRREKGGVRIWRLT